MKSLKDIAKEQLKKLEECNLLSFIIMEWSTPPPKEKLFYGKMSRTKLIKCLRTLVTYLEENEK